MVGLCIKYFHENYGGMLQAFATTKLLEVRGIEYELIQYEKKNSISTKIRFIPRLLNQVLINDKYEAFIKKQGIKKHPDFAKNDSIRMNAFGEFKKNKFTKFSPVFTGYKELCQGTNRYSTVMTGSDQLWSPAGLPTNFYNLMFVPNNIRKVSYASSFGVKQIPWYQKTRTKQYLDRIEFISMRENRGSQIVKELTNKRVETILDPVFMLDKQQWAEYIPLKKESEENYIFAYFLGENSEHRQAVNELSQKTGLKVIVLRHLDQYIKSDETFGDFAPYDVGPEKFLNLIRGASFICTDSFHGACFSIINEKKFMIFNRYDEKSKHSKNSRIDTLCDNLEVRERRFDGENIDKILRDIDYSLVKEKLEMLKVNANNYLDMALSLESNND